MNAVENHLEENDLVYGEIAYIVPMSAKPRRYLCSPPPGVEEISWKSRPHLVPIRNGRLSHPGLDAEGFVLRPHTTALKNFVDANEVRSTYYPEVERLVKDLTGASTVIAFDHNVRSSSKVDRSRTGAYPPARFAHADYTLVSGPQRVRDLLPYAEAAERLKRRFVLINVWRSINRPIEDDALAVCDARSLDQSDLVATDLVYTDRIGEFYNLLFKPAHRWHYFPRMERDEAMIFKCFDSSDSSRANCVPHSSFHDPQAPESPVPRESIEIRTVAFY